MVRKVTATMPKVHVWKNPNKTFSFLVWKGKLLPEIYLTDKGLGVHADGLAFTLATESCKQLK